MNGLILFDLLSHIVGGCSKDYAVCKDTVANPDDLKRTGEKDVKC